MSNMLVIGLTGGIGSGKSTVAALFEELRVPVLDADVVTRMLVEPGQPALADITAQFGDTVLNSDGTLDRAALRDCVFNDPDSRLVLENILHPRVRQYFSDWLASLDAPYAILVIPLLFESGQRDLVQRVLVVDSEESDQVQRVLQRDTVSTEQVESIMAVQWSRQQRLDEADDVILNDRDLGYLRDIVKKLHQKYLTLSL